MHARQSWHTDAQRPNTMKTALTFIAALVTPLFALAEKPPVGAAAAGPLFHEAEKEFTTMKTTLYQHKTEVDRAAGSYKYDCALFVSYAMRQAAPVAFKTILTEMQIARGYVPSPPKYQKFFTLLAKKPLAGWEAVPRVGDLRPGDVVSWEYKTERANGHAVIIADVPKQEADGSWAVKVYDSTSTPHLEDSRPNDSRAQVFETTGRKSGLGHGIMAFTADPATGAFTGYRWTPSGKIIVCPIAAGRPKK